MPHEPALPRPARRTDAAPRAGLGIRTLVALLVAVATLGLPTAVWAEAGTVPVGVQFRWTAPARYIDRDGDFFHDDLTELVDRDFDGHVDPHRRSELVDLLSPGAYPIELNACLSGPTSEIDRFDWRVSIEGSWIDLADDGCEVTHAFPAEGTYPVEITAVSGDERYQAFSEVVVNDIVVVGFGDSYGSGEGAPEIEGSDDPTARWSNPRCHRSARSDQALTARALEMLDPHSSVTFIHVACSGAQISEPGWPQTGEGGILSPYDGTVPGSAATPLPAQIDQVRELLDAADPGGELDREIDAVLLSGGGNDMNFVPIMTDCVLPWAPALLLAAGGLPVQPPCYLPIDLSAVGYRSAGVLFDQGLDKLGSRLPGLPGAFAALGIEPSEVHQREYPDPAWLTPWLTCPSMLLGIGPDEVWWASQVVLKGLNDAVHGAAADFGWNVVDGVDERYRDDNGTAHGECSWTERWINWPIDSVLKQGDEKGIMHPNAAGYEAHAGLMFASVRHLLTDPPPPCPPTASLAVAGDAASGWVLTNTSTSPCGDVAGGTWTVNGRHRGWRSSIELDASDLRCGQMNVSLAVASPSGERAVRQLGLSGPSDGGRGVDDEAPWQFWAFPGVRVEPPAMGVSGTGCDGERRFEEGTDWSWAGYPDCLARPDQAVQPAAPDANCLNPANPAAADDRWSYTSANRDPAAPAVEMVAAVEGRLAIGDPADHVWQTGGAGGHAYYRVEGPPGSVVSGEIRLSVSQHARPAAGASPCRGDLIGCAGESTHAEAFADAEVSGSVDALRPTTGCDESQGCGRIVEERELGEWRLDTSVGQCVVDCFTCSGFNCQVQEYVPETWSASRWGFVEGEGLSVSLEPIRPAPFFETVSYTIPFEAQVGEVLRISGGVDATGSAYDPGSASAHSAQRVELVVTTPGAALTHHTGGATIEGTITAGDPICGATVMAFRPDDGWSPTLDTTTDCDGAYSLDGLDPGVYQILAAAPGGDGLRSQWYGGTSDRSSATLVTVTEGGVTPSVDIELQVGGSITGTATDEDGHPVAGATVWAYRTGDTWVGSALATTDEDGTFVLEGLTAEEHRVVVIPPAGSGLRSAWVGGTSRADATPLMVAPGDPVIGADATLAPAGAITGTVTGPGGVPVTGATVWAYAPGDGWVGSAVAITDGSGRYSLLGLRPGAYRLLVVPPDTGLQRAWYLDSTSREAATPVVVAAAAPVEVEVSLRP